MSYSIRPQLSRNVAISAFLQAGLANCKRFSTALTRTASVGRPMRGDRKYFCRSTATSAVLDGSIAAGPFVVSSTTRGTRAGDVGVAG